MSLLRSSRFFLASALACLLLLMVSPPRAAAQTTTGTLYGSVTDVSGGLIPAAPVTATRVDTGEVHTTRTSSSGEYTFPALAPGSYRIQAQSPGFKTEVQKGIRLDANQNVHVTFMLNVGAADQTVTVEAGTTLVDTRESQLGETIDQNKLENLPILNRTAYALVQTLPGVTNYQPAAQIGDVTGAQFSVNGMRVNENSFYLDGGFDGEVYRSGGNLIPNPDALEEFRMLTSNYDAEFGRSPGGVLNIITRSGSNAFHGIAYDYLRNNIFNAKSYFDGVVTPLRQNQFGGTVGGPIIRNKAFFFLAYEGLRIRTTVTISNQLAASITTPTAAEAGGDFRNAPNIPTASLPNVSCNGVKYVICGPLLDSVAQKILAVIPVADPITGIAPTQSASAPTNADQGLARLDYQLTRSHKLSFTFFESQGSDVNPISGSNNILDYGGLSEKDGQTNLVFADTWTLSASKLNSFRAFYTLNHYAGQPRTNYTYASFGSPIVAAGPLVAPPILNVKGYFDMTSTGSATRAQLVMGGMDTFLWSKAHHEIKFGGSFFFTRYAETGPFLSEGTAAFSGSTTGNSLADFLEGHANTFEQNNGVYHRFHAPDPALFAQDNWRIASRLTLNLGVRWEIYYPFAGQNLLGTFEPGVQSTRFPTAPLGLLLAGDPGIPDGIRLTSLKDFAPRVGFAYDVFGDGKTGLHGAYGIFYSTSQETLTGNLEQMPFLLDVTVNKTPNLSTPYSPGVDPFPYSSNASNPVFPAGATLAGLPPNSSKVPYVQQYNLTLEQQFGPRWGARIAYVGNVSREFYVLRDQNSPIYSPTGLTTTAGLNARRPYEPTPKTYTFGQIGEIDPASNGSYNGLQMTLTHRMTKGFSLQLSYVWSKTLDDVSTDPSNGTTVNLVDSYDIASDYGKSGLDVPQTFVATYLWSLPGVKRWGFVGREVLSGWQINGITSIDTGSPYTVNSGVDSNKDGNTTSDRPNVIGNPVLPGGRSRQQKIQGFFNPAAFADPAAGVPYGNEQRDMLIGPGYVDTDLSAFKKFPLWRDQSLEFRAAIFNIFDNVNLGEPSSSLTSPTVGQISSISSSGEPRIVQFALKYMF